MGKITDLLKVRASVRTFQNCPIPQDVVDDILIAGRLSPSGGNEQPWRFGVITDPVLIAQIVQNAYHQTWITQAPLLIVLCTAFASDERGGRQIQIQRFPEYAQIISDMDQDLYWALNQEEHQTKIAGTHMILAALEHGVGCCWVSRFVVHEVGKLLNLPNGIFASEILVFGYPEREPRPTPKKSLDDIVFYL